MTNGLADRAPPELFPELPDEQDPVWVQWRRAVPWAFDDGVFAHQLLGCGPSPDQGWKLHVSATAGSAAEVLARALPVLLAEGARFKLVRSREVLLALNNGAMRAPQVGKFITVYPSDDDQAVRLAVALDGATCGRAGPRVPTDRPLRPGSVVHYRYGSFRHRRDLSPAPGHSALEAYDLLDADGRLTIDPRTQRYEAAPSGVVDPFEAAGVYQPPPRPTGMLGGRYLVHGLLARTWRGGVYEAVDVGVSPARACLLKEFWHDVGADRYGREAPDWGRHEAEILQRHHDDPVFPCHLESFTSDGNLFVALEYVSGTTLASHVGGGGGGPDAMLPPEELIAIARGTAELLAHLHEVGVVFRDVNPRNVLVIPDGSYRLIDFGIAHELDSVEPPLGRGVEPFVSPQQHVGQPPVPADDVFAWAAMVHCLATGTLSYRDGAPAPGPAPPGPFVGPPLLEVHPTAPPAVAAVVDRALRHDPTQRYPSMVEVRDVLREAAQRDGARPRVPSTSAAGAASRPARARATTTASEPAPADPSLDLDPLTEARLVGDALCDAAIDVGDGVCWGSPLVGQPDRALYGPDLYDGAAGVALYLAALARVTGSERYRETAVRAASWLCGDVWGRGRTAVGLHSGESGVGLLFVRLAAWLDEPGFLTAAALRARRMAGVAAATTDLISGTAGRVYFLTVGRATGDDGWLREAAAHADVLIHDARSGPEDPSGCYWEVPSAGPDIPGGSFLGLAHGAAGIGLALGHLGIATGEQRLVDTARRVGELLLATALEDEPSGGWAWRRARGDAPADQQAWCHGAAGIGAFFLHLDVWVDDPRYREAARQATVTMRRVVQGRDQSNLCHGVAGDGSFFLDRYAAVGDASDLDAAWVCARRLDSSFRDRGRPGVYRVWPTAYVSPALMVGYAGVGSFFLRLARPTTELDLVLPLPGRPGVEARSGS